MERVQVTFSVPRLVLRLKSIHSLDTLLSVSRYMLFVFLIIGGLGWLQHIVAANLFAADSQNSAYPISGLVAYYTFNNQTNDAINGNHAVIEGNGLQYVTGVHGNAIKFGGYNVDRYARLKVPTSSSLQFSSAASFSMWIRLDGSVGQTSANCSGSAQDGAFQTLIGKSNDRYGLLMTVDYQNNQTRLISGLSSDGKLGFESGGAATIQQALGNWIHVAQVFDATGAKLYLNGVLAYHDARTPDFSLANSRVLYFGLSPGEGSCASWWYPLNGALDEVRIYNRGLTAAEVQELYQYPVEPTATATFTPAPTVTPTSTTIPTAVPTPDSNIKRVSIATGGNQSNSSSFESSISADGSFVTFSSYANNLVGNDTNDKDDIFVHDAQNGITSLVSVASDGTQANNSSDMPRISGDGRFVVFTSYASNLVSGDTNNRQDIFIHDRLTKQTERVSIGDNEEQGNGSSAGMLGRGISISTNGRYVAFVSSANNLVPNDINGHDDVFVRDRQTGTTKRISSSYTGGNANGWSTTVTISSDGRYIVFDSTASNLVPNDTGSGSAFASDIFVYDSYTAKITRVSIGRQYGSSDSPVISADGQYIAFTSSASNLVPNDTNGKRDIFLYNQQNGITQRISVATNGFEANKDSYSPAISADGKFIVFMSEATNLVTDKSNDYTEVFVFDRINNSIKQISYGSNQILSKSSESSAQAISANGRFISFESDVAVFIANDTNDAWDIFVYEQPNNTGCANLTVNVNPTNGGTANVSPAPDCPNDNSKYKSDTLITLTASANQGYNFASWSGDVTATENPTTITLGDQGRFVTANFNHKESEGPQLLANNSFESNVDINAEGAGVWRWLGNKCFAQVYGPNNPAGDASEGQKFLVTHGQGTTGCTSFYQDIVNYPRSGDHYTFLIDARAPANGVSREFSMVLRALSYDGRSVVSTPKKVIVTQNIWSTYQVDLVVNGEYDFLRTEVYLESPENGQHINYNFDNARLHGPARMKISGKINFPNTEPISGVTLKLLSTNGSQLNATTTNETGTYSFGFIDYGEYRIQPELGKYTFKSGINCPSEPIFGTCQFGYSQKGTGSLDFSSLQNALNKPARVDLETRYLNEDQSVGIRANGIDQAIVWAYVYNDLGEPIPGVKLDMVFPGSDISKINTDGSGYTTDRNGIAFFNVSTTLDTTRLEFEILWNGQKLNGYRILVEPVTVEPEKLGGYLEKCVNSMKDVHLLFDLQTINEITKSYRTKLLPENILASQLGFALGTTNLIFEASSSSQELLTSSRMIFPGASYIEEKTLRNWQYPVNEDMIQYRVAYGGLLSALDLVPSLLESGSVYQDSLEDALTRSIESGTYFNNHSLKSFEFVVIGDVELGLKDYFTGNNSQDIREGSFDHIVQNNLAAQRFSNEYAEDLTARILAIQFLGNQYTPIQITLRNVKLIDEANEEDPDLLINRFLVSTIMLAGFDGPGYVMNAYNGYHGTLNDLRSFTKGAKMVALGSQAKVGLNDRLIMFGANCNSGISQILHQVKPKTVKADITSIEPIMQGHYIGKGNKKSFIVDEARLKVHVKTNMPANVMAYADYYPSFMNGLFLAEGGAFIDGDGIIEIDVQTGSNYTNGSAPRSGEDVIVTLIGSNETGSFFLGRTSVKWPVPPAEIRASGSTIGNEDIKIIEKPLQYYAVDSRSGISISFTLMNPFPYDVIAELRLPAALKNIIKDSPEVSGEVVKWLIPMKPNETVGMVIELTDYIKEIPAASLQMLTYQGESMLEWSTVPEMFEKYFPVKLKTIAPFVASANSRPDHKVELENISNNTVQSTVYVELYHANALIYSDSKMTILQPGESTEELFSLPADLANGQYLIVTKIEAEGREFRWPDQMTVGIYGIEADFGTLNSAGVAVSENITYSIHITNISQAQLSNVTVRSTVSDTTDLIQDGGAIANAQSLVWNVGNLGAGQNRDFQFVVRLSERSQDNLVVSSLQITSDQTVPLSKTITNFIKADNASPNFVYLPLITR